MNRAATFGSRRLACALVPSLLAAVARANLPAVPLSIDAVSPAANYQRLHGYQGGSRLSTLVDGQLESDPMWIAPGTSGWQAVTPVSIAFSAAPVNRAVSGEFRFHVACRQAAGIHWPRRIDLYARQRAGYVHIGALSPGDECDRNGNWLELRADASAGHYIAIVHANGAFVFLDEIQLIRPDPANAAEQSGAAPEGGALEQGAPEHGGLDRGKLVADSISRLKRGYLDAHDSAHGALASGLSVWTPDPWMPLDQTPSINAAGAALRIEGANWEKKSVALGLAAGSDARGAYRVTISPAALAGAALWYEAQPILAASGALVFDPLLPLDGGEVVIADARAHYLWLKVDLARLTGARVDGLIRIESSGHPAAATREVRLQVTRHAVASTAVPAVIAWGYKSDLPIWRNSRKALDELREAGVNVQVIPPGDIPDRALDARWDARKTGAFWDEVTLLSRDAQILLFTDWNEKVLPAADLEEHSGKLAELRRLVEWLDTSMAQHGIANDRWALYPRDEPHDNLQQAVRLFAAIKQIRPLVRIYVNPTTHRPEDAAALRELRRLSAYWQPNLATARSAVNRAVVGGGEQWLYDNPAAPAKAAAPLSYRKLAWWALQLKASGLGFWSFSDTAGSSAWDDFDGVRPDWAAVYEDRVGDGIVSSRRWEAFKEGIEDFRALKAAGYDSSSLTPDTLTSAQIEEIRSEAFR